MQAFHPGTGMTLEFPDNTPDEAIQQHFQNAQASMPINAPSVAQQFLDGARGAYEQQQLAPAPVNGAGFVGLDPQQAQFMLQQRQNQAAMQQQSASDQARNRIEQQKMTQQSLESAADRAQTLKLRKQELQNLVAAKKIEADADKFEADLAAKGKELDRESRLKLEEMRQAAADRRAGDKLYNLNGQLVDGSGNVIADNTRQPAPRQITGSDFSIEDVYDPASGSSNKYSVNKITGERTLIGPAPPVVRSGKSSTEGKYRHPTVSDSIKISERIDSDFIAAKTAAEAKARAESGDPNAPVQIDEGALREEVSRKVRRELGVSAFPDKESAKQFMDMQAEQFYNRATETLPPGALTPETAQRLQKQATNLAQVERWKADGYVAYLDPETGEAVVETDDGKEPGT